LFFRQLILLLCNTSLLGTEDDERINYYSECKTNKNIYASKIGAISSYGNAFQPITIKDLVYFNRVIVRDSCTGGGDRDIY